MLGNRYEAVICTIVIIMEVSNDVHKKKNNMGCLWLSVVFGKIVTKIKYI